MPKLRKSYHFPDADSLDTLMSQLSQRYPLVRIHDATVECSWLDSFDWRLHRHNLVLTAITQPHNLMILTLAELKSGEVLARSICKKTPAFVEDLPTEGFVSTIGRHLYPRKLLKQLTVEIKGTYWQLVDDNGAAMLNFTSQQLDFLSRSDPNPGMLVVTAQPGAESPAKKLLKMIAAEHELQAISFRKQTALIFETGNITPAKGKEHNPSHIFASDSTDAAVKKILAHHLDTVEANLGGTILDLDSEFLHSLRVALRRSRSVLGAFKKYLPREQTQQLLTEMKWAFRETDPKRDTDVHLLSLPAYRSKLPVAYENELQPLAEALRRQKALLHPRLVLHLKSERFRQMLVDWRLLTSNTENPDPSQSPVGEIVSKKIKKSYKKLVRDGLMLDPSSPASDFHELRKIAKKHRYLLDSFAVLYPIKVIKTPLSALKQMQDALGTYQDRQVQITALTALAREMHFERRCAAETLMAMGVLTEQLLKEQTQARAHFQPLLRKFAASDIRRRYKNFEPSNKVKNSPQTRD